jgi:hypothetical protein
VDNADIQNVARTYRKLDNNKNKRKKATSTNDDRINVKVGRIAERCGLFDGTTDPAVKYKVIAVFKKFLIANLQDDGMEGRSLSEERQVANDKVTVAELDNYVKSDSGQAHSKR